MPGPPPKGSTSDLLLRAARGESTERTPVWMMRQAGRTDPAYVALREKVGLPLEDLFRSVDYSVEISLLPQRIGVDAIVFFQDILTPLAPMGAEFVFRPGPVLESPIRTKDQVESLHNYDLANELPFVGETLRTLRKELEGSLPLLGFAGAPVTLLFFMVEGGSPGTGGNALRLLEEDEVTAHVLLETLTAMTIDYLNYQIESGAQAVQLFESVADLLTDEVYQKFALPYHQRIFESLHKEAASILFAKGFENLEPMRASGADVLSVSSGRSISEAREILGNGAPIQGNVSNRLVAEGTPGQIEKAVRHCIASGGSVGHILNLDHGLLRETPWENVQAFVRAAKDYTPRNEREGLKVAKR